MLLFIVLTSSWFTVYETGDQARCEAIAKQLNYRCETMVVNK